MRAHARPSHLPPRPPFAPHTHPAPTPTRARALPRAQSALIGNADIRPSKTRFERVWRNDYWGDPMDSVESHKSYRPLTILSFRLNYAATRMDPRGFHLGNVALHALASVLLLQA